MQESKPSPLEQFPEHEKIGPTAKFVAHLRTLDNIPFAREIAQATNAQEEFQRLTEGDARVAESFAPVFEARYKTINKVIEQYPARQFLELAAGLSPRGLEQSQTRKAVYIETDLEPVIKEKQQIVQRLLAGQTSGEKPQLYFEPVNAVERADFEKVSRYFQPEPATVISEDSPGLVISEGVLLYLNRDELQKVAENIRNFLTPHGGVWITDVVTRESMAKFLQTDPAVKRVVGLISGITERSLESNPFRDEQAARKFFEAQEFKVNTFSQRDVLSQLTSTKRLELDPTKVEKLLEPRKIWALEFRR